MSDLPMHGASSPTETLLDPEPAQAFAELEAALSAAVDERALRLRDVAGRHPTLLDAWARLAEWELEHGEPVTAYAYARVGYHRGLDRLRQSGWRGQGMVPWHHAPNQGFLRALHALMAAAAAIGEDVEASRCRNFLLELDPDDGLGVRGAS